MKVNTDSLILGSWAYVEGANSVLDVGTGSGILALMLAQRTPERVLIDAIEVDCDAAQQASENAANSKWPHRINVLCKSLQEHNGGHYDVIVSNPPYFLAAHADTKAYDKQSVQRATARQIGALTPADLFSYSQRWLARNGWLNCVYPYADKVDILAQAKEWGLSAVHLMDICHDDTRAPYLCAFRFQHTHEASLDRYQETLFIRDKAGEYSEAYKALCKPFYLKF